MGTVQVRLPPKLIPVFTGEAMFRGAYGGRGSAKTRSFAKMAAIRGLQCAVENKPGLIVCGREFMNSLEDSSLVEVQEAILSEPWLAAYYDVGRKFVRTKDGKVEFSFTGLRHSLDSIKSKSRIRLLWVDEAEPVSKAGWTKAIPTVREDDAEIWVTWNPESEESETHKRFRHDPPTGSKIIEINWRDNPWFTKTLDSLRLDDQRKRPDEYDHIWEGEFLTISDAIVFAKRVSVETFDEPPEGTRFFYGADWGFANDPATLVRCWMSNDRLYIDHEAFGLKTEIDELPELFERVPGSRKWPIKADAARPETISYMSRRGFNISAAKKWDGSVEDGIAHLKGFERIVVHERCQKIAREFRVYSYKVDKKSGDVLPLIVDRDNHGIDAVRYALDGYIRRAGVVTFEELRI